jgi:hypothetical protein
MNRRTLINGTALSALLAAPQESEAAGGVVDASDRQMEQVVLAVKAVRDEITRQTSFWEIAAVRDQFRSFLRANGKFPDFVDVGAEVWQQVYDWHVRFQQPIGLSRTPEGRMAILLMTTTVIMRTDQPLNYVSPGYDR